jgi:hypothetical protein
LNRDLLIGVIIGPVVVGFVLLSLEYSLFIPETEVSKAAKTVVDSLVTEEDEEEPVYEIEEFIEPDVSDLKVLLTIAKKINVSSTRNSEFSKLVTTALDDDKPAFAAYIAKYINVSSFRNEEYVKIIRHALVNKQFAIALSVTQSINVSSVRNQQYQEILDASSSESHEPSNKDLQATAVSGA